MTNILPDRTTISKKQLEWLKNLCDMAGSLAATEAPLVSKESRDSRESKESKEPRDSRETDAKSKPQAQPQPAQIRAQAAILRDELHALLVDVAKADPWK